MKRIKTFFSRGLRAARHGERIAEKTVSGTVVSVHTFQSGARDVLVAGDAGEDYVRIPAATPFRHLAAGERVTLSTTGYRGQYTLRAA